MKNFSTLIHRPRTWRAPAALAVAVAATVGAATATKTITAAPDRTQAVGYSTTHAYTPPPNAHLVTGVDDYPFKNAPYDGVANSDSGFIYRNCTDFVAYRLRDEGYSRAQGAAGDFKNKVGDNPLYWSHAYNWANAARSLRIPVDTTPTVGAVAVFPINWHSPVSYDYVGEYGHVAVVLSVDKKHGLITIEDYNWQYIDGHNVDGGYYHQHTLSSGGLSFIHFPLTSLQPPTKNLTLRVADAKLSGHYASARLNNSDVVQAYATAAGPWEHFTFIPVPGKSGAYYLKSQAAGKYISARFNLTGNQRGTLYATTATPGAWETFYEQHVGADQAFYVYDNTGAKWYVATEMNNGGTLRARTTPAAFNQNLHHGSWELFYVGS